MRPTYQKFICHFLKNCSSLPVMMVLGDPFQQIFEHLGSDNECLLNPEKFFGEFLEKPSFTTKSLSICWRITVDMADWINKSLNPNNLASCYPKWWEENGEMIQKLWGDGIKASPFKKRESGSVVYIKASDYLDRRIDVQLESMFSQFGNEGVAVISRIMTNTSPINVLINNNGKMKNQNWKVLGDDKVFEQSEKLNSNKRLASTIHKFKGLERDGIMFCGFDSFLETLGGQNSNPLKHFNVGKKKK